MVIIGTVISDSQWRGERVGACSRITLELDGVCTQGSTVRTVGNAACVIVTLVYEDASKRVISLISDVRRPRLARRAAHGFVGAPRRPPAVVFSRLIWIVAPFRDRRLD